MTVLDSDRVWINRNKCMFFQPVHFLFQMISTLRSFLYIRWMASLLHLCSPPAPAPYPDQSSTPHTPVVALMHQWLFDTAPLFIPVHLHQSTFDVEMPLYLFSHCFSQHKCTFTFFMSIYIQWFACWLYKHIQALSPQSYCSCCKSLNVTVSGTILAETSDQSRRRTSLYHLSYLTPLPTDNCL